MGRSWVDRQIPLIINSKFVYSLISWSWHTFQASACSTRTWRRCFPPQVPPARCSSLEWRWPRYVTNSTWSPAMHQVAKTTIFQWLENVMQSVKISWCWLFNSDIYRFWTMYLMLCKVVSFTTIILIMFQSNCMLNDNVLNEGLFTLPLQWSNRNAFVIIDVCNINFVQICSKAFPSKSIVSALNIIFWCFADLQRIRSGYRVSSVREGWESTSQSISRPNSPGTVLSQLIVRSQHSIPRFVVRTDLNGCSLSDIQYV